MSNEREQVRITLTPSTRDGQERHRQGRCLAGAERAGARRRIAPGRLVASAAEGSS